MMIAVLALVAAPILVFYVWAIRTASKIGPLLDGDGE